MTQMMLITVRRIIPPTTDASVIVAEVERGPKSGLISVVLLFWSMVGEWVDAIRIQLYSVGWPYIHFFCLLLFMAGFAYCSTL
jgi:hypothetical protein